MVSPKLAETRVGGVHPRSVDSDVGYFLIIVLGLPLLLLLLTGPGMWSEKWGWRVMDRLERSRKRLFRRRRRPRAAASRDPAGDLLRRPPDLPPRGRPPALRPGAPPLPPTQ